MISSFVLITDEKVGTKPLGRREQAVFDKWRLRRCAELWAEVRSYLVPLHEMPNRSNEPPSRPGNQTDVADHRSKTWLQGWLRGRCQRSFRRESVQGALGEDFPEHQDDTGCGYR